MNVLKDRSNKNHSNEIRRSQVPLYKIGIFVYKLSLYILPWIVTWITEITYGTDTVVVITFQGVVSLIVQIAHFEITVAYTDFGVFQVMKDFILWSTLKDTTMSSRDL